MSATTAEARLPRRSTAPSEVERRPRLEAVPRAQKRARPRAFYAVITVATILTIVLVQLLLSIGVTQGAYRIENLQGTGAKLSRAHQEASEKVDTLSSPQNLAANANALGMVNNGTPVYLRLSDGAVIGSPAPASAAAGKPTGASGNLVPNALTKDIPLVTAPKTSAKSTKGAESGAPASNAEKPATTPVPWQGALPAPSTH